MKTHIFALVLALFTFPASAEFKAGHSYLIQNSRPELNDQIVTIDEVYDDGALIFTFNFQKYRVSKSDRKKILYPEANCIKSEKTELCKGDLATYMHNDMKIGVFEWPIEKVFVNGKVLIDGILVDESIVKKKLEKCSDIRPEYCLGDKVICTNPNVCGAVEGEIEGVYSDGQVRVRENFFFRKSVNVKGLAKRIESSKDVSSNRDPKHSSGTGNGNAQDVITIQPAY